MYQIRILVFLSLLAISVFNTMEGKIVHLKTEYVETPLGVDVQIPRFSWQMEAVGRGKYQTAYRIVVTEESGQQVWDSEKIPGASSLNIAYAGTSLRPCTRYNWTVTVWDQKKKKHTATSWFETGLMNPNPDLSAWSGACWIGGGEEDMVLYSEYLPVFKMNCSLQLDKQSRSTKAGFMYGMNDPRLMDRNKNLYKQENQKDSSYILLELDIAPLDKKESALLHVYRVGYKPGDRKDTPLKSFAIPGELLNSQNGYETHKLSLSSVLGDTYIYLDGEGKENFIGRINLNPLGQGGDFIAFPVVGEIGFYVPKEQIVSFSEVQIRNYRSPSNVLFSMYSSPCKMDGKSFGAVLTLNPSGNSMPMLRTAFSVSPASTVSKARLYVTARGIYEVYMNGKRIGTDFFNPGSTQYTKTHLYQTYDVTDCVQPGDNVMGAVLGEGWWSGGATYMGDFWNFFGDRQSLLAKLIITYSDGTEKIVVTNPSTWKYFNDGPLRYGSFFQGEVYNAWKEAQVEGWTTASYDDSGWKEATEVSLEGHICTDEKNKAFNMPIVDDYTGMALTGQFGEGVQKIKELTAVAVEEVRPGVFIYDMGQNMAGVPKIALKGMKSGMKLVLRFAEVKYPDLPEYKENTGMLMLENIRAAMAQDIYITKGGEETIHPRFTSHGYRYIEITGIDRALPLEAVKGEVLSSIHGLASHYETSNPKVNKLWENITWSTYSNFISIPTDCPQRNERLGWSGDISVFARTATYLADVSLFLRRHMRAMRDTQREDGRFPDIAPMGGGFGSILWGSAGITVAWENYQQYADKDLLAEHYEAMVRYIECLLRDIDPKTGVLKEQERREWGSLGDWLSLEDGKNEKTLFWESYFLYDLEQMGKIASVLGKKEDAERFQQLYAERKDFFNKTYIDSETGKTAFRGKVIDTQTSYVLPFAFNLFDENRKEAALNNFVSTVTRQNRTDQGVECPPYSLMTGFIGTAWISKALSDYGYSDMAYRLLQQAAYPSWLYPVEQGATTIWERLNSYTHMDGFGGNNRMNSFNHYSFGAVGAWMYDHSLGIRRDEDNPGFKHFILAPEPDPTGQMTYARGHYDSMYGRIESGWERKGNNCSYRFVIPANTSAVLYLEAPSVDQIQENGKLLKDLKYVDFLGERNGKYVFELQSGRYDVQVGNRK